jgi:hypothetical protein
MGFAAPPLLPPHFANHHHGRCRRAGIDCVGDKVTSAMKHRKLRIAWSVFWGIAAALLVALWVRSYSYFDAIANQNSNSK